MFARMPAALAFALLIGIAAPAAGQPLELRPGLWEITMAGMPQKITQCFTAETLKDVKNLTQKGATDNDCKSSNESVSGNTRTFNVSCTKPNKYDAKVSFTVNGPDNFTMRQNYNVTHAGKAQQGTMTMSYKRVGSVSRRAVLSFPD
jgi:hypothetical protein